VDGLEATSGEARFVKVDMSKLADAYGVDTTSTEAAIAFAIEHYERGLISVSLVLMQISKTWLTVSTADARVSEKGPLCLPVPIEAEFANCHLPIAL